MRVRNLRRIVRNLGTEERTEPIGEVARDLVTATADGGTDGGEDGLGIGSRYVLERAHAASRDGEPRASPAGMNRRADPALGREEQDRHAVGDPHRSGDAGLERDDRVGLDPVRPVAFAALGGDAIAMHLVSGRECLWSRKTGFAGETAQILLYAIGIVADASAEVQAFQRSGRDAAGP